MSPKYRKKMCKIALVVVTVIFVISFVCLLIGVGLAIGGTFSLLRILPGDLAAFFMLFLISGLLLGLIIWRKFRDRGVKD